MFVLSYNKSAFKVRLYRLRAGAIAPYRSPDMKLRAYCSPNFDVSIIMSVLLYSKMLSCITSGEHLKATMQISNSKAWL